MANEYVLSTTGEEATRLALAKKVYASNVLRFYQARPTVYSTIPTEDFGGGVSKDVVCWYKMTTNKKADHAQTSKQNLVKKVLTLRLEDDEFTSATNLSKKDAMIVHYDASGNMAKSAAEAMSQLYEQQAFLQAIATARTAASGPGSVFPGGQRVLRSGSAVIATAYPDSIVGSRRLQDDIKSAHKLMFEDNVPQDQERYWYMKYREWKMLQQDPLLMSRDYVGEAYSDVIKGKLVMVDGAWILPSNLYPQSDLSTADDNTPTKNGTNAYLIDASDSVALCLTADALRKNEPESVTPLFYWDDDRRNWTIGAVGFKTIETYRPEHAAEVYVSA